MRKKFLHKCILVQLTFCLVWLTFCSRKCLKDWHIHGCLTRELQLETKTKTPGYDIVNYIVLLKIFKHFHLFIQSFYLNGGIRLYNKTRHCLYDLMVKGKEECVACRACYKSTIELTAQITLALCLEVFQLNTKGRLQVISLCFNHHKINNNNNVIIIFFTQKAGSSFIGMQK